MTSRGGLVLAIGMLALAANVVRAQGDAPVRMILEAEDFVVERGWQVVPYGQNYFASTFAITFLSRQACLGAAEQAEPQAAAALVVDVPVNDVYQVLARYEQPYQFAAEFDLEIEQNGKSVRRAFGRPAALKYWAFQKGKTSAMQWWFWGGGDNIVWEKVESVKLERGKATLRLSAGPQLDGGKPRAMAARRHVDVICLTNDVAGLAAQEKPKRNYLPFDGWLTQEGDLFVRVTNPKDGLGPCLPALAGFPSGQRSPWFVHDRDWPKTQLLSKGRMVDPMNYQHAGPRARAVNPALLAPELPFAKKVALDQYLQPGETSGWAPLGQVLDALHVSNWVPQAKYVKGKGALDLELEFAVPDGKGGLKSVHSAEGVRKNCDKYQADGTLDQVALVSYGDEHYVPPAKIDDTTLADWLKARNIAY